MSSTSKLIVIVLAGLIALVAIELLARETGIDLRDFPGRFWGHYIG